MKKPTYNCECGKQALCIHSKTIHERSRKHQYYLQTEAKLRPVNELLIRECLSAFKNGYYNDNDYDTVGMKNDVIEKLINDVITDQIETMPIEFKKGLIDLHLTETSEMDRFFKIERNDPLIHLYLKRITIDVIKNSLLVGDDNH